MPSTLWDDTVPSNGSGRAYAPQSAAWASGKLGVASGARLKTAPKSRDTHFQPPGVVNLYFRKPLGMDAAAAAPGSGGVALGTKLV